MSGFDAPAGVEVLPEAEPRYDEVLSRQALGLVAELARRFGPRRLELL